MVLYPPVGVYPSSLVSEHRLRLRLWETSHDALSIFPPLTSFQYHCFNMPVLHVVSTFVYSLPVKKEFLQPVIVKWDCLILGVLSLPQYTHNQCRHIECIWPPHRKTTWLELKAFCEATVWSSASLNTEFKCYSKSLFLNWLHFQCAGVRPAEGSKITHFCVWDTVASVHQCYDSMWKTRKASFSFFYPFILKTFMA